MSNGWDERAWHQMVEQEAARLKRLEHTKQEREAPDSTYQAAFYELRTHGVAQLSKPNCQRRLGDLSHGQLKTLIAGLQKWRGQYPNISDELLNAFTAIYDARTTHEQ
jgi:hypothetical protein